MKKLLLSVGIIFALSGVAQAKTPPEVLEPYKAYNAAMQSQDYASAIKHAKIAWEKAEKLIGDSAITGDLAYNYGYIEKNKGDVDKAIKALERSADLASMKKESAELIRLEREIELIACIEASSKPKKSRKRVSRALKFAKENGLNQTVFAGELYVHESAACSRVLNSKIDSGKRQIGSLVPTGSTEKGIKDEQSRCGNIAEKAIDIFAANPETARPSYVSLAYQYAGFASERNEDWLLAIMKYQKSREAVEKIYPRDSPIVANAIGRWINARNFIERKGLMEVAKSKGMCDCWPYSYAEKISPVSTVKADFPAKALRTTSGYAILKFDVNDAGVPEKIEVVNSYPGDIYDKNSIKAIEQWRYPTKQAGENEVNRKEVYEVLNFYLSEGLDPT